MTDCNICAGARMVLNSGEASLYQSHVPCPGCNAPEPPRWTWERLRDFFASGGKISMPTAEDLMLDARPVKLAYGGGPRGGKTAEIERWLQRVSDAMGEVPAHMGVDLAHGRSESWLVTWDPEQGKMIYRKVDPADMVRRDEEGEGSPDNGNS